MIFSYCITKMMFLSFCNECSSLCLHNIPSTYIVYTYYYISLLTSTPTTYFYIDMCVVLLLLLFVHTFCNLQYYSLAIVWNPAI